MRILLIAISALAIGAAGTGLAQSQHDTRKSGNATDAPSGPMPMMESMAEQCRAMMQNMPESCMSAEMMQDGMTPGHGSGAKDTEASHAPTVEQSDATKAYMAVIEKMHQPMADGIKVDDPDLAFVRGMIPHHQSAIDMAKIVQQYGDDDQTKKWAAEIIEAQEREIAEMQAWLEENAR